jgi:hypothetical protein
MNSNFTSTKETCKREGKENIWPSRGTFAFWIHILRKLENFPLVSLILAFFPQILFHSLVNSHPLMPSPPPSKEMDLDSKLAKKKAKHQLHL